MGRRSICLLKIPEKQRRRKEVLGDDKRNSMCYAAEQHASYLAKD